jgi:chromatin remodeling complex protein RSC6
MSTVRKSSVKRGVAKKAAPKKVAPKKAAPKKAAAKKAAPKKKAPGKKPAAKKAAPKKKPAAKRKPNAAFMKAMMPSAELAAVVGDKAMPRTEITKKIWDYIKKNKLQDKTNTRRILPATLEPQSLTNTQIEMMVKDTMVKWVK